VEAGGTSQGFGGEVSAADGAFHGGGPSGGGPVAGNENARPRGRGLGAMGVDARARRVGCANFFNDGGFHEVGGAGRREKFPDFSEHEVDDFGAGFFDETF
jgi:hypothetical protein